MVPVDGVLNSIRIPEVYGHGIGHSARVGQVALQIYGPSGYSRYGTDANGRRLHRGLGIYGENGGTATLGIGCGYGEIE